MSPPVPVAVERLAHGRDLPLPACASPGAAGLDLVAALPEERPLTLRPGERALVPTGLRIALPPGYEAQVRPRSGLALRHGLTVLNAPGTIDSDYRGEVGVLLVNLGSEPVTIRRGERIAQLVLAPVCRLAWEERPVAIGETVRGPGGFGSTGRAGLPPGAEGDGSLTRRPELHDPPPESAASLRGAPAPLGPGGSRPRRSAPAPGPAAPPLDGEPAG